jgi:hypothetical protein
MSQLSLSLDSSLLVRDVTGNYRPANADEVMQAAMTVMTPWLSQAEIDDLCQPLRQTAAQIRHLRRLGLVVRTKPNGAALVMRTHLEAIMNPVVSAKSNGKRAPNRKALIASFSRASKCQAYGLP